MPKVTFRVARYDPEKGSWWQTYEVEVDKYTSVAVALQRIREEQDPTLAYRPLCKMGVCGNCAVKINGRPRLGCMTNALEAAEENGGVIVVEPLDNMPVVKDLVVDRSDFERRMIKAKPYLVPKKEALAKDSWTPMSPKLQAVLWSSAQCIWCGICYSACPSSYVDGDYVGPHGLLKVFRFSYDPRDSLGKRRVVLYEEDIWKCVNCGNCTESCPKNLGHDERFMRLRADDILMKPRTPYAQKAAAHVRAVIESIVETGRADEVKIFASTGLVEAALDGAPKILKGGWKRLPYKPRKGETDRRIISAFSAAVAEVLKKGRL